MQLARDHAAAGAVQLGDDQEGAGDGEHADHDAARLPGGPGRVDAPGAARVLRATKALRVELPEGPLRLWTVSLGPALCLRDLLAGSSEHCAPAACRHFTQNSQFCKPGSTQAASDAPFW